MNTKMVWILVGLLLITRIACFAEEQTGGIQQAQLASTDQQYERLGLERDDVAIREDGTHTEGAAGTYEWWYVDLSLEDGSVVVIVFYTRSPQNTSTPLKPFVTFDWTKADGTVTSAKVEIDGKEMVASTEQCDVRIGDCTIKGDLKSYDVIFKNENIKASIKLNSALSPWRAETGYRLYGNQKEDYAAWLCAVPDAIVEAEIITKDEHVNLTGTGYHDHNWGNQPIWRMQNDWYWGRAKTDSYVVIAYNVVTAEKYGYTEFPGLMLSKNGQIISDDLNAVTFTFENEFTDEKTGISIAKKLIFDYDDGVKKYQIVFNMKNSILSKSTMPTLSKEQKKEVTNLEYNMHYYRFIGSATVTEYAGDEIIASEKTEETIWELMYPGKLR